MEIQRLTMHPSRTHQWRRFGAALAVLALAVVLGALVAGGLPTLLGYDSFVATGGSMSPAIGKGSVIVAQRVDPATIEAGDIITFSRVPRPDIQVTHRVVAVEELDGAPVLRTKGDANGYLDPEPISFDQPVSKLVYTVPYLGYLLTFSRGVGGKLLLIALPAAFLVLQLVRRQGPPSLLRRSARRDAPLQHALPLRWDEP